jgi:LAO/AO transport system kinase
VSDLAASVVAGERRAIARAISLVEDQAAGLEELVRALTPRTGRAHVIGLTGAPGAGKSTLTSALVALMRAERKTVAVLAVDPSSPFTGGALLGDRLRMQEHATDEGVYIRSMATRGALGGLSLGVPHALRILDAAGFEVILLETVGVGQAEVDVAHAADTTIVVVAPGMGDSVQANKAGILEIADLFCVNKADRPDAKQTERDLTQMLHLGIATEWSPPVVLVSAQGGTGIDALWSEASKHHAWGRDSGALARRRQERAVHEITELALAQLRRRVGDLGSKSTLAELATKVAAGELDPYTAANALIEA